MAQKINAQIAGWTPPARQSVFVRAAVTMRRAFRLAVMTAKISTRNIGWRTVRGVGWDPNTEFTPEVLYGVRGPGALETVRTTHPILSPAMDRRREWLASQQYQIVPRTLSASGRERAPTDRELECAAAVAAWFDACASHTLADWVTMTYDTVMTYGHAYQHLARCSDGWHVVPIDASMVEDVITDEETRSEFRGLRLRRWGGSGAREILADACAVFVRSFRPGQFRGESVLRPMLATQAVEERLIAGVLRALAASTGAPVVTLNQSSFNESGVVASERAAIDQFLGGLVGGPPTAATFKVGTTVEWISSPSQALSQFGPIMQSFDIRTKEAVMSALSNLGGSAAGSRALGEVVAESDETQLRQHVEAFLRFLSGDTRATGTMMRILARLHGFDDSEAPRVELRWDIAREASLSHVRAVLEAVAAGVLSVDDARPFVLRNLRTEVGQ